jgi:hypothetical protein
VNIMTARVCDANGVAGSVVRGDRRGVRQSRILAYGKRVHIGTGEGGLAVPVAQDADHAGAADAFNNFVPELLQFRRRERSRFRLLKTELRFRVQVLVRFLRPIRCCR